MKNSAHQEGCLASVGNTHRDLQNSLYPVKTSLGYSRKNPLHTPPTDGVLFYPPLSPGFPEAQDPTSQLDFQGGRPPLPPGFPGKNKRLKFNLFLMENTRKHV